MGCLSCYHIRAARNIEQVDEYDRAVCQKQQARFVLNACPIARLISSQHVKDFVIRPQSTKISINYDDQICLHQQSINKSCSDYAVSYPGKNILLEGCENSLINYRCSATYHILYFEVLNIHISTCYICVEVFVKLFRCFFMLLSTKMLSRIKTGVC